MVWSALATDTSSVCSVDTRSDILLIVDTSPSMANILKDLVSTVAKFSRSLSNDTNFALVTFGGVPVIRSDFTSDKTLFNTTLNGLKANGFIRRAAFEAIRMALGPGNGKDMSCVKLNSKKQPVVVKNGCKLSWRRNARRFLVLVTNSDSDLPTDRKYQTEDDQDKDTFCPGFYSQPQLDACIWPNLNIKAQFMPYTFMKAKNGNYQIHRNDTVNKFKLADSFEKEIELTSSAVLSSNCSVYSLISTTMGTSDGIADYPISVFNEKSDYVMQNDIPLEQQDGITTALYQFGSPIMAHQHDNLSYFDADQTLANLKTSGCINSLQAKVLEGGGLMRNFDIDKVPVKDYGIEYLENIFYEVREHIRCSNSSKRSTSPKRSTTAISSTTTSETQGTSSTSLEVSESTLFFATSTSTVQYYTTTTETSPDSSSFTYYSTKIVITDFTTTSGYLETSETVAETSFITSTSTSQDHTEATETLHTTTTTLETLWEPSTTTYQSTEIVMPDTTMSTIASVSSSETASETSSVISTSTHDISPVLSTTEHFTTITTSGTTPTSSKEVVEVTSDMVVTTSMQEKSTETILSVPLTEITSSTWASIDTTAVTTRSEQTDEERSQTVSSRLLSTTGETTTENTITKVFHTVITNITTTSSSYSLTIRKITTFTQAPFETPESTDNNNTRSSLTSMEIAQFVVFGAIAVCAFSVIAWVARRILK